MHLRARQGFRREEPAQRGADRERDQEAHRNMPADRFLLQQKQAAQQICQVNPLPACTGQHAAVDG